MAEYRKTIYYSDELNDDFASMKKVNLTEVDEDFPFRKDGLLWKLFSYLLYYDIAKPIILLIMKLGFGIRIENKKALKTLKKQGYFLYGNHCMMMDPVVPALLTGHKKAYIIAGRAAVSIPYIKRLVLMLGGLPIPNKLRAMKPFMETLEFRIRENACIAIYPEAHIWPFYIHIRPFGDVSFHYPAMWNVPAAVMTTTFRKRTGLFFWCKRPGITVTVSGPFYPDMTLSLKNRQRVLRDEVYNEMCRVSDAKKQYEYFHYERQEEIQCRKEG